MKDKEEIRKDLILALAEFVIHGDATAIEAEVVWPLLFTMHNKYSHEVWKRKLEEQRGRKEKKEDSRAY